MTDEETPWTGCGAPPVNDSMPRIKVVVEQPVVFLRCPKCLGHLRKVEDVSKGQDGMFWDCPRCSIRLKIWEYFQGMK